MEPMNPHTPDHPVTAQDLSHPTTHQEAEGGHEDHGGGSASRWVSRVVMLLILLLVGGGILLYAFDPFKGKPVNADSGDSGPAGIQLVEYDLRVLGPVASAADLPKEGRHQVVVALVNGVLALRVFDVDRQQIVDTDVKKLQDEAGQGDEAKAKEVKDLIEKLHKKVQDLSPPHTPTEGEKGVVVGLVNKLAGPLPYNMVQVPQEVRDALGIRNKKGVEGLARVEPATLKRKIVMPGSTALDPSTLYRVKVRFAPCEVYSIAKVPDLTRKPGEKPSSSDPPPQRELRSGDTVTRGQLLAVVYSVDVGQKKNDLIDAASQLKLDEEILKKAVANSGSLPEVYILNARRNVEADHNSVARALNTLKAWNIPPEDIKACFDEADEIMKRFGKREHNEADLNKWARVEIRAPEEGVIVERNLAEHEIVNDNTVNLFQIAKVDRLAVYANAPEDEVEALGALPTDKREWKVKWAGLATPIPGRFDDVSYLIDPNQHTAVVKGRIDNPNKLLRAGQFVSVTVELDPPADVVEVPVDAVVEDGQTSVVFVQEKDNKDRFVMRRVQPTQRFDTAILIRSKPFEKKEERTAEEEELGVLPRRPLLPGEVVLTSGVGELKAALLDLQSQPNKDR